MYMAAGAHPETASVTTEICMTGLDRRLAALFYRNSSLSGVKEIMPEMDTCEHDFEPCGYSMNGVVGAALSSIHVAPEEEWSYASYEAAGFDPGLEDCGQLVDRVLRCFEPEEFSMAVTVFGGKSWARSWGRMVDEPPAGYCRRGVVESELPGGGLLVYQVFCREREEKMGLAKMMARL